MIADVLDKQQALFRRNLNHFASLRSYAQLPLNRPALAFLRLFKQQILNFSTVPVIVRTTDRQRIQSICL